MDKITFCIPSKNNCRYLKACIPSIRKNSFRKDHDIIVFVDADNDGTVDWLKSVKEKYNLKYIINDTGELYGIGKAYDKCIKESTTEVFMIFHADMMLGKDADKIAYKQLTHGQYIDPMKRVVCATRIEPPLHPENGEKIIKDFGMWPETDVEEGWREDDFNNFVEKCKEKYEGKITNGLFAPWMMFKESFVNIGGHDPRFASAREDSDVFNRLYLSGFELIQSWESFVYHLTARGGQFQHGKLTQNHQQKSEEWQKLMYNSTREFFRKWGTSVQHDNLLKPIITPKYNIGFVVDNLDSYELLYHLEPWCTNIYGNFPQYMREHFIEAEKKDTMFDLNERVRRFYEEKNNDILIKFDAKNFTQQHMNYITNFSNILSNDEDLEVGEFELDIFNITIINLQNYEKDLIVNENTLFNTY